MKLNSSNTAIIKRLLIGRKNRPLNGLLSKIEPKELASLFSTLNRREIKVLVESLIVLGKAGDTLAEVPEQQLDDVLSFLTFDQTLEIIKKTSIDNCAHFLNLIPQKDQELILTELPYSKAEKVKLYLSYPEDSTGRMMLTSVFNVPLNLNASEAMDSLRKKAQTESIYYIYCTSEDNKLVGVVSLRQLAIAAPDKPLSELVKRDIVSVKPTDSEEVAAQLISKYDLIALPVVDNNHKLLGVVTVDDILDIIQEQATADIYAQAGLQEDDRVYTSVTESVKKRIPWMFLNLFLAAIASSVVSLFEETMSHLIILASLKNIVAGMGGNTAIQSLTVVTRGLATGDFSFISYYKAIRKEISVGLIIGICTGIGAGVLTYVWKGNLMVSYIICASMIINSLIASTAGAFVPIALKKFGYDPATGGGVIVTMATDIFSFFSFLGIATLALKYFGV